MIEKLRFNLKYIFGEKTLILKLEILWPLKFRVKKKLRT